MHESPRVALFSQDLDGGGAQRVVATLAAGLVSRDLKVDMVLVRPEGPFLDSLPPDVRVVNLGTRRVSRSIPTLARYLRREQPAALLSALTHVNLAAILAARLSRVRTRVVVTEHSLVSRASRDTRRPLVHGSFWFSRWLYPLADAIVAISDGIARDLARSTSLPPSRIRIIYNPVVTPDIVQKSAEPVDHPWFQPGGPRIVLGVGRLSKEKDFATLVRAFARLNDRFNARLVILGEGPLRSSLDALADELQLRSKLDLPGFVANPYAWMARSAVLGLASTREGLSNVLIEAMACGTPVVSTDCDTGPSEVLKAGLFGRLVPVGNADALADALARTLETPPDREALRKRASDFSAARAVSEYLDVLVGTADH